MISKISAVLLVLSVCACSSKTRFYAGPGEWRTLAGPGIGLDGAGPGVPAGAGLFEKVRGDFGNFYSHAGLGRLYLCVYATAPAANTELDHGIREYYQDNLRSGATDRVSRVIKPLGDCLVTVPIFAGAMLAGGFFENSAAADGLSEWGERSLRASAAGLPAVLVLQPLLGSARPDEGESYWHPFRASMGASGHAFIGAVPFLTAARMTGDTYAKASFYTASALCGLTRVNDDKHYFSQVALGWLVAYLAVDAVESTSGGSGGPGFFMLPGGGGGTLGVFYEF